MSSSSKRHYNKKQAGYPARPLSPQSSETDSKPSQSTIFETTASDIPTPPLSPVTVPEEVPSFTKPDPASLEANSRILNAKRDNNLKAVMTEFGTMKKRRIPLTYHTYNLVLDSQCTLRREGTPLTQLLKVYDEMLRVHIRPNSYTYTVVIRALCKRDVEVQKTVAMLKRQSQRTGYPCDDMKTLQNEKNLEKALQVFRQAAVEGLVQELDVEVYNQLLRVLSHYSNTSDALFVFEKLDRSAHASPNSATFAALINLFGRSGDIHAARSYFQKYCAVKSTLGPHDASYVYNALVDSHLKCGQLENAFKVIERDMKQDGVKMTAIPYNSIIRHYCAQGQMDKAKELLSQMETTGEPMPDASSYGPVLAAYCHLGHFEEASGIYEALLKTDIAKAYGNLANYALLCVANDRSDKALEVVEDMRSVGLEPEPVLAQRIVTGFAAKQEIAQAIGALHTVLTVMSPRSVSKGMKNLISAALKIVAGCQSSLRQTLSVAHTIGQKCHTLPANLASYVVESYRLDKSHRRLLTVADYAMLYDSTLLCTDGSSCGELVMDLLDDMRDNGLMPSSSIYSRVLAHLEKSDEYQVVAMWKACFQLDEEDHELVRRPRSPCKPAMTREAEVASSKIMKAVMQGQREVAVSILQTQFGLSMAVPVPEVMRDAIALVGKQGHMATALVMYDLCMQHFENLNDADRPRAVYMISNSLLIGYAQQGDMMNAKKYYDAIKAMGQYPDGNGYASLLLGSAKCTTDEASDALTIYEEAKRHNVKPTTFFYNVIISKLAKARKLDMALALFEEMQQFKVMPNSITYGAIISACVRAGSECQARRLFGEMLSSPSYQARVGPFNNMMQFYVHQQPNRDRVLEYFAELRRRHIKPSPHSYRLLMEAYASMAPYDMPKAYSMLAEMERVDSLRPQATHYATLIYSYGTLQRDVQSANRVFAEMRKAKVPADEAVYQAMIDTLISNDQLHEAEKLYAEMVASIPRTGSPYIENLFIRGYGDKSMLDQAEAIFNAMSDDKLSQTPSVGCKVIREPSTYEAMVRSYMQNNMVQKAKAVLDQMAERVFPEKVIAAVADLVLE
ncbi:uncharacterized protein BYT42DRAFT_496477 [Radiomyces spectabilis]|uniref:uncharacterized protein n=1 Tax=Radiomyces spectabilis TaxID=64574 RepID=UPI002220E6EB|nr:uncharacterized protein BYT42DRAFT_496477 [Radiomyces spectabilis]KAI8379118.1 hypothetical protein BYT42DRAFT_496477 [Radiomyces spectabilis]